MITRIIGIDFGTSTSVVKVFNDGDTDTIYTLSVGNGMQEIPTLIFERKVDGKLFIADKALSQLIQATEGTIHKNFKLGLISNNDEEKNKAIEYTTLFFKYLKEKYDEQCRIGAFGNCDATKVYISYPAKWPSFVRLTMLECAIKAGFGTSDNVFGLDEPTAAAVASFHEAEEELRRSGLFFADVTYKAMMVDMGAGTTDIVLFEYRIENGSLHINNPVTYPTAESTRLCGGREIDDILSDFCINYSRSIPANGNVPQGLLDKCHTEIKPWKEAIVSEGLKNNIEIQCPGFITQQINLMRQFGLPINPNLRSFRMNRLTFESISQLHWENWRNMIAEAFEEGKKFGYESPEDINVIILTGGHSQWYCVKDFFLGTPFANIEVILFDNIRKYPASLIQSKKPSQTVATGLCLKDKAIVAATPLANSFWIQFEYEDKKSEIIKIADKGHHLPFHTAMETVKDSIKGHFLYRRSFDIKCVVYEGTSVKTAKKHIQSVQSPDDNAWTVFIKAILFSVIGNIWVVIEILKDLKDIFKGEFNIEKYAEILDANYPIELGSTVDIAEDGIATVAPCIKVDGNEVKMPPFKI